MSSTAIDKSNELIHIKQEFMINSKNEIEEMREKVINYIKSKNVDKKLSKSLEYEIYNDTLEHTSLDELKIFKNTIFKQRYNYRLLTVILNIEDIKEKILNDKIKLKDLFNKKPFDIFPERWEEVLKRKNEEEKFLYERKLVSNSYTAKCFKCKEKNVYVTSKQTRSADEPETIFYYCLTCSNRWKS